MTSLTNLLLLVLLSRMIYSVMLIKYYIYFSIFGLNKFLYIYHYVIIRNNVFFLIFTGFYRELEFLSFLVLFFLYGMILVFIFFFRSFIFQQYICEVKKFNIQHVMRNALDWIWTPSLGLRATNNEFLCIDTNVKISITHLRSIYLHVCTYFVNFPFGWITRICQNNFWWVNVHIETNNKSKEKR